MADNDGVKKPPHVGSVPGSTTPPIDLASLDEESLRQYVKDRYLSPTDEEYTAPQWMTRMEGRNYNHFFTPEGDIKITYVPMIFGGPKVPTDDPIKSTMVQVKGLENPEEVVHFFYEFARGFYLYGREEKGFSPAESLSYNWLKCAESYASASEKGHPPSDVGPITLQRAIERIEYQIRYGCGMVTLDATLAHLWAYWERRAKDAASGEEKDWSDSMANKTQFLLKLMSYGNHDDLISFSIGAAMDCCQKAGEEEKGPQYAMELSEIMMLHSLASAEICYRHAACATENAVRRGHILKSVRHITVATLAGKGKSDAVWTYADNLYGLMKGGIEVSPVTGSCSPVGIQVPGYGPTAASIASLYPGFFLVRPLTPIV